MDQRLARVQELSALASSSDDPQYLSELHRTVWQPGFTLEQRHFFYWQRIIRHSSIRGVPALEPAAMYLALLESARREVGGRASWIPARDRDPDSIIVITNQLLALAHAPTADCLDYCHVLQTRLEKKVLLINTAAMPWNLALPYHDPVRFNRVEDYSTLGKLSFRGVSIDFYQCKQPMPNVEETRAIIGTVLQRKPSFVLSLGHSNVAPDLCAEFLTVATMPFGTNLPQARSNLYILPRARRADDAAFMREWDIGDEQIIEAPYTFRLPERTATLTRADLGLPDDAYVIAVVGNRLDSEITEVVAGELETFLSAVPRAFVAFVGTFPGYGQIIARHRVLAARSAFLGHQKDVLAVFEHCDAYYNPPRYGGGSSAAFAIAMGVPVLTRAEGDVANIVGPRFHFASADAMLEFIRLSIDDPERRREWSAVARERFAEIADREAMLRHIIEEATTKADVRSRSRA